MSDFYKRQDMQHTVLAEIVGGLWHTTHPDRFLKILECGALLPEPDIPDHERWKASRGKEFFSYVRFIGGVSLFDFAEFEPDSYSDSYPASMWTTFVPYDGRWKGAVWIQIDRSAIFGSFIAGLDLLRNWKQENAHRHTIMPKIEAAHIGPLPRAAFSRAFFVGSGDKNLHHLDVLNFDSAAYNKLLDGWRSRNSR